MEELCCNAQPSCPDPCPPTLDHNQGWIILIKGMQVTMENKPWKPDPDLCHSLTTPCTVLGEATLLRHGVISLKRKLYDFSDSVTHRRRDDSIWWRNLKPAAFSLWRCLASEVVTMDGGILWSSQRDMNKGGWLLLNACLEPIYDRVGEIRCSERRSCF